MSKNKKKKKKKKKGDKNVFRSFENESFSLVEVAIITCISVVFGVIIGYMITYGNSNLRRVRTNTHLGEVVRIYNNLVDDYYDQVDESKLSEAAIKGMISYLGDPYSTFLDEGSTATFNESVDGEYVGIGITAGYRDGYSIVISVVDDGPADKAGLLVDDVILSVDDHDCKGLYPDSLSQYVSVDAGTSLEMKILRGEEEKTFTIKREVVEYQNVSRELYTDEDKKIGYIQLSIFSSNSYSQFSKALEYLEEEELHGLILDLRSNPGGQLNQAKDILNLFFSRKTVLYQVESKGVKKKIYATTSESRDYPVVILVNKGTASAAEILAACFKDNYSNIHLVGTKTYGKGNVQRSLSLGNGTSVKFTIEQWLTPKGKSVSGLGIEPDVYLEQNEEYYSDYSKEKDVQLQTAISLLK